MTRRLLEYAMVGSVATLASLTMAFAAGPYDGTWEITAPETGVMLEQGPACPAVRFEVEIKDNQLSGSYAFVSPVEHRIVESSARGSSAMTGNVQPDGTLNAEWMGVQGAGKLAGNSGDLKWVGECGPRVATAKREAGTGGAN